MFTGSLRFNVDPFNEHPVAVIEALLVKAGLSELLEREPESAASADGAAGGDANQETHERSQSEVAQLSTLGQDERQKAEQGRGIYMKIAEGGSNLSAGER